MLKRSVVVASMLAIGCVLGFGTLAFTQEKKPPATRTGLHLIHAAAKALEDAEKHLQRAEHHFGGHRAKALELVKQAEGELKQAVEYAKANPPAPSKPASTTTPATTPAPATPPPPRQTMTAMLALHTWTLDTTPLADALRATRTAGWDGVELRRIDFARAAEKGQAAADVLALVKASGLRVACVGVELGWMFADGDERRKLMQAFDESCRWAVELGCQTVMSASDRGRGDLARAAANMREAAGIAASHRVKLAVEFNSQADQLNNLEVMRGVVAKAAHASCGLLLDTYHLQRSGASLAAIEDVALGEIAYFQYSDVPRSGLEPGKALDRLPPGRGSVPFKEIFALLDRKGYRGFMSYEAPNPAAWARPADEVAREALDATRAHLPAR